MVTMRSARNFQSGRNETVSNRKQLCEYNYLCFFGCFFFSKGAAVFVLPVRRIAGHGAPFVPGKVALDVQLVHLRDLQVRLPDDAPAAVRRRRQLLRSSPPDFRAFLNSK